MFRKALTLTAIVLVLSACAVQADVIHSTWVGGEEGSWGDASNWDPPIVPDNNELYTFVVTIDSNYASVDEVKVGLQERRRTIDHLDCYGEVQLEKWTLYGVELTLVDPNGLTNQGHLEIWIGDDFEIVGNVNNIQGSLLEGGFDVEDGNLINGMDATFINGTYSVDVDKNLYNYGRILSAGAGHLCIYEEFHNFGHIDVYGGICESHDVFTNYSGASIQGYGLLHSGELIDNKGIIKSFGGGLLLHTWVDPENPNESVSGLTNTGTLTNSSGTTLTVEVPVSDVNNQGIIEVNADGSVVFDCNLVNEPNATISLRGGTLAAETIVQKADANFAGFGGITGDVFIDPNGIIELTGPTNIVGDVEIEPNATLEISDGTALITGHTICNNGTIHMIGGRVICQGGLTNNNCNIIWEPGTYTNAADFNLDGTVNFKDFADFANTWLWQASWR